MISAGDGAPGDAAGGDGDDYRKVRPRAADLRQIVPPCAAGGLTSRALRAKISCILQLAAALGVRLLSVAS